MNDAQEDVQLDDEDLTTVWVVITEAESSETITAFWTESDALAHASGLRVANPDRGTAVRNVVVRGQRRRCRLCGEPVVLDDPGDPMSWIHAEDANDLGDHTAEV